MRLSYMICLVGLALGVALGCNRSEKVVDATRGNEPAPSQETAKTSASTAPAATTNSDPLKAAAAAAAAKVEAATVSTVPETKPAAAPANADGTNEVAVIKTSQGTMVLEFWTDVAPQTVANFKKLAREGFYDGTAFHRIIDGFMIQGGDPLTKDSAAEARWGTGGPGYTITGETNQRADRKHVRGVISMAHSGHPNTAGSQFFICLGPASGLDGGYTTFGKLIKGDDVLEKLGKTPVKPNPYDPRRENSRPIERVGIESIKIVPANSVP